MRYIFINHGFMGSNIENWFPYVKQSIDNKDNQVIIPQYPVDVDKHFYDYWKKVLNVYKEFNYIKADTIMIGHSSGCAFTIKYLIENNLKIDKLILVCGFNNFFADDEKDFHNVVNKTLYVDEEKLNTIKNLCNKIICIYGDNDPYIPQNVFHNLAKNIDADEIIITNGGHINTKSGFTKFEELLKLI